MVVGHIKVYIRLYGIAITVLEVDVKSYDSTITCDTKDMYGYMTALLPLRL